MRKGRSSYWIWASLFEARKALDLGMIRIIGDGADTWFDRDPWIPTVEGHRISSPDVPHFRVKDWMEEDSQNWNWNLIHNHCSGTDSEVISRVQIGTPNSKDKWVWKFTTNGGFSVRSAYHGVRNHARQSSHHPTRTSISPLLKTLGSDFGLLSFLPRYGFLFGDA
ncbi:unnamed protein product [Linum trigynum]|uniref:Uncharacterized protein n=1 Tax=Linum trigynum TaxID=586398 RepID=A0AAV2EDS4_9ROSI